MPCAAGSRCVRVPDHTPVAPGFTKHPCRICGGYLHGMCGVVEPESDSEMQPVCHSCVNTGGGKISGADTSAAFEAHGSGEHGQGQELCGCKH